MGILRVFLPSMIVAKPLNVLIKSVAADRADARALKSKYRPINKKKHSINAESK